MEEEKKKDSEETTEEEKTQEEGLKGDEEMEEDLFTDDEDFSEEQGDTWEQVRVWFQDNLRVILSVLIVALIAVGIYNYSKRPAEEQPSKVDQLVGEQGVDVQQPGEQPQESGAVEVKNQNTNGGQVVVQEEKKEEPKTTGTPTQVKPSAAAGVVEKTQEGYKAQAAKGNGTTNLAREALRKYLGENADAGLTKEHKIYIEDYLRKHVSGGSLKVGDNRVFSESLIKDAISQSKQLNDRQLKNLQQYSARVSNL